VLALYHMFTNQFKSSHFEKISNYRYFVPNKVDIGWILASPEIMFLNEEAGRLLGELNGYSQLIPNIDLFISMHILKEAQTSSKIKGTETNLDEALMAEVDINPERRDDWEEVQNYIKAINFAINKLDKLPLSTWLIRETHNILLQGVRGKNKQPGELRQSQNWIGGATLSDATFIPPAHHLVQELLSDLEKFLQNTSTPVPNLIKIAIAHYQFETIHPFLDGNGRIGRLLITLFLVDKKLLVKPTLYLSQFFEANRQLYYDNLNNVREFNKLEQWLKFFLVGVIETSKKSIFTLRDIIELREKVENKLLPKFGVRMENALVVLKFLYSKPIISIVMVESILDISTSSANKLVASMVEVGILREITGQKRNRLFVFDEYLEIFNK
jgi:Fic family protein